MLLIDIKNYLAERGTASLSDIALHFGIPQSAAEPMLAQWERKGTVTRLASGATCGTGDCDGCKEACSVYYRFNKTCVIPIRSA
jgi:hypothetical protein